MPIIDALKNFFFTPETKAIVGYDSLGRTNPVVQYGGTPLQIKGFTSSSEAQSNWAFYTILTSIQTTAKSIPWNAYKITTKDENGKKMPESGLGKLVYRPNPKQSWTEFVTQYIGHYLSTGNVFIYLVAPDLGLFAGQATELYIMPLNTEVVPGEGWLAPVEGYRFLNDKGGYEQFKASRVIHIKAFNLNDNLYGYSPLAAGALALSSLDVTMRQRIEQQAKPSLGTV